MNVGVNGWPNWACLWWLCHTAQLLIAVSNQEGLKHLCSFCNTGPSGQALACLGFVQYTWVPEAAFQHPPFPPGKSWKQSSPWKLLHLCQQYRSPLLPARTVSRCHKHVPFPDSSIAWETLGPGAGSCNSRFPGCWGQLFFPFLFLGLAKASGFH